MKLKARLVSMTAVTKQQREAMWALMDRHYENVDPLIFVADLAEKRWVILLFEPASEELCGFSTQMLLEATVAGRPVKALFSGDTVVARECWGDSALARVWGRLALSLIDAEPSSELYWFLISKGYKTYRYLPLFFHEFYPRYDVPTPSCVTTLIDALAHRKYGSAYDASANIIRADSSKDRLRRGVAEVSVERLRDPHVAFFIERNPGHAAGDELCCIAPLTRANFTRAGYRVIGSWPASLGCSYGVGELAQHSLDA
jgi:hypothetical protein